MLPDLFTALPDDRALRWERLAAFVERWWGPLTPADGVAEAELRAAEERLGFALPAALREAYQRFGERDEIASTFTTLLPPRKLSLKDGLLVFWVFGECQEWGIRERDLALPDPPTMVRERLDREWHEFPALPSDPSLSRLFVWQTLEQATHGSRYDNSVYVSGDVEHLAVEVARHFQLLDFGLVEHPLPETRLYVGEDVLIAVRVNDGLKVVAPNLAGYRRGMDALRDLSLTWEKTSDRDPCNGESYKHKENVLDMELMLVMAGMTGAFLPKADPRDRSLPAPAADDRAAGRPDDLDPRLSLLVERALRPHAWLLPPTCVATLRAALELVLQSAPALKAGVGSLLGKQLADDVASLPRLPPEVEARVQAMTPEQRATFDAVVGTGLIQDLAMAVRRRFARMIADHEALGREMSAEEMFDFETARKAEGPMSHFLSEMPDQAVADHAAAEAALAGILRILAASLLAGIVGAVLAFWRAHKKLVDVRYARALFVGRRMVRRRDHERIFTTYYLEQEDVRDVARDLGIPAEEEHARHRAFLEQVASWIETTAEGLETDGLGPC